jgi:hypothetical protein
VWCVYVCGGGCQVRGEQQGQQLQGYRPLYGNQDDMEVGAVDGNGVFVPGGVGGGLG